ncbi:hypothetical protein ACIBCT_40020 [Streptosporangium sp. NPDC050855]|uniref:hypothetical protein n=1 Tax=Streptosporangium sp. NPDC050855 TaxID=3366194 RepID=UPI00379F4D86
MTTHPAGRRDDASGGDESGTQPGTPLSPALQSVTNSVIFGDLIQIAHVGGNVNLTLLPSERGQIVVGDIPEQPLGFLLREGLLERVHIRAGAAGATVRPSRRSAVVLSNSSAERR